MIETTADMVVFLLILSAVLLVLLIVGGKFVEKIGQSLRGWLG